MIVFTDNCNYEMMTEIETMGGGQKDVSSSEETTKKTVLDLLGEWK